MTESLIIGADGLARPAWAEQSELLRTYYDTEWGNPVTDEAGIFERLSLEAFQSGLSWATILKRREGFREAFSSFDPEKVAAFDEKKVKLLLSDARIIRNEKKIRATINNARATLALRDKGGLASFVWSFQPEPAPAPRLEADIPSQTKESAALAKTLKKEGFRFVGPTTMYALMQAIGMVNDHLEGSWRRLEASS